MAIAVALATPVGVLSAAADPAPAPAPKAAKTKVVKISGKQFPKLLDRPGSASDVIVLTKLAGADWFVGSATEAVKFEGSAKTASVSVSAATTINAKAAPDTEANKFVLNGPSSFTYTPTDTPISYTDDELKGFLTFIDLPGTKGDSVVLTKADGVHWKIGEVVYDEAKFGKKGTVTAKLPGGEKVFPVAAGATLAASSPAVTNGIAGVSSAETITYTAQQLAAAVQVGDNPLDATKGMGKGASVETVQITGLPGLGWTVGSSPKAVKVKPGVTVHVPVPAGDLDTTTSLAVAPQPASGVTVPTTGTPAAPTPVSLNFADPTTATPIAVGDRVADTDRSGTTNDTLVLPTARGMSWFAGQRDAKNKLAYKQLKAGKDGNAVYKVKHSKDGKPVTVSFRAVPDRGYLVSNAAVQTATFTVAETTVAAPALTSGTVTLSATADGIGAWNLSRTLNGKSVKVSYKPADLTAAGATSIVVPTESVDVKILKGYKTA
ncbi:hypothetical protein BJY21_000995 [Kineosphaera limosa]|uniref:hypothetical protein n=1 Tax=Kineosphaera limosa TaxID=111564 RepID=UPI0012F9965B|nr:hypothetical protein [Kineosphaera limosa]NYD99810.1 hypothetical protein [Kineosphaera limosa]